ncbi:unnamed protein product, partial [Linum tenue]
TGSPKLDSPWYKEFFFARPSWKWYHGDTAPLTGYVVGSKDDWCVSTQFPQSVRDHVDRLVEGFQLRVFPSGPESAYQHVRKFYGLRALADAVRPKRRRVVVKTGVGRGGSSSVAVGDIGVSVAQPPPVQPMAAPADVAGRRGSKRVAEKTALGQASQRAKASSPPRKAAGRGKGVKRGEEQSSIEVSTQAATDGEAAE